jgi:hypothetical protein
MISVNSCWICHPSRSHLGIPPSYKTLSTAFRRRPSNPSSRTSCGRCGKVKVSITDLLRDCARRLGLNNLEGEAKKVVELALGLNEQFPEDVDLVCAFFLQVGDLASGWTFSSVRAGQLCRCALFQCQFPSFHISYSHFFRVLTTTTGRYYRSHGDIGQRPPSGAHAQTPRRGHSTRIVDMDVWRATLDEAQAAALVGNG